MCEGEKNVSFQCELCARGEWKIESCVSQCTWKRERERGRERSNILKYAQSAIIWCKLC